MVRNGSPLIDIDKVPLHEMIIERLQQYGDKIALVNGQTDESYTYQKIEKMTRNVASGLHRLGVRKGDILVLFSPNSSEFLFTVLAVLANGVILSLPNSSYTSFELSHALKLTSCSWIVTTTTLYNTVVEAAEHPNSKLKGIIIIDSEQAADLRTSPFSALFRDSKQAAELPTIPFSALLTDDGSLYPNVNIDPRKDVAFVFFSSGTTGLPKGVMISHYNIVAMLALLKDVYKNDKIHTVNEQGTLMAFLPFCHCFGLVGVALHSLNAGFKMILLPKYQLDEMLSCIEKYKVTMVYLVPPIIISMLKSPLTQKYNLSSVRRYHSGAATLKFDTEAQFKQKFGVQEIHQGYGMTEMTMACLRSVAGKPLKFGSVGFPLANTDVQVIDVETGIELGPNLCGEVIVKGPQVMLGYLNNPAATLQTIDVHGWLHTGDIGYYDEDGYFFIVDRIKELIKYKGLQVAPAELESLILTHPHVEDVAVIGVPDDSAGEIPKAFVVVKSDSDLTELDIKQFVASKVSNFKQIRGGVEFIKEIPKSASGKILRRLLRDRTSPINSKL